MMWRVVRALIALGFVVWALFVGATFIFGSMVSAPSPMPQAQAIVVISGPGAEDDMPIAETADRMRRGVALWQDGAAPLMVVSGSGAYPGSGFVPDSVGMRRMAEDLGVPPDAIVEEDASFSTLQNALFTADLPQIDPTQPILLVTNRFHLGRAWLSFRWAGFENVVPVPADPRSDIFHIDTLMEGIKGPFNLLRALGADGATALGVSEARVETWLR